MLRTLKCFLKIVEALVSYKGKSKNDSTASKIQLSPDLLNSHESYASLHEMGIHLLLTNIT